MRTETPLRGLAICAVMLALGAAGCGEDEPDEEAVRLDLVVGNSIPLTGEFAALGPAAQKSADLAIDRINAAINRAGADHVVEIVHEDTGRGPGAAVRGARAMVQADDVSCITGPWTSADTEAVAREVAVPDRVLEISPAATSPELTELDDEGMLARTAPPDPVQAAALADAISSSLDGAEGRTVNLGVRDDDYGGAFADAFVAAWEDLDGVIGDTTEYDPEDADYSEAAEDIVKGRPDAIVIADFPDSFAALAPALAATAGWDPARAWGTDALATPELGAVAGAGAIEGMRGVVPGVPQEAEASVAFDELFADSDPKSVERARFDAQAFDAVVLCYLAAVAAGSTDGEDMARSLIDLTAPVGPQLDWRQLPEAIETLQRGDDIDYVGASGPVDLDATGDASSAAFDVYVFAGGVPRRTGDQVMVEGD